MYTFYTDKQEVFECKLDLEGAKLTDSKVRLVLESSNYNLLFYGKIDENGKCEIPVKKLKSLLQETDTGKVKLEVIAEDTYFEPWNDTYNVKTSKKVTVEVVQPDTQAKKPIVEVKVEEPVQMQQPTPTPKVVKPVQKVQKKDPIAELKKYLSEQTYFTGTLQSFKTAIKQPRHRNYFNTICEANKLDKKVVLKQILS